MAFAFVNIFEASIASKIHDYARLPSVITVRVLYQNHILEQDEEYAVTLPRDSSVGDLQRHMAEVPMFKQYNWKPREMDFYEGHGTVETWRFPLAEYELIDDSCLLQLYLIPRDSPSDDDTATQLGSDESETEDEDDAGPWRIATSMRRAMLWDVPR